MSERLLSIYLQDHLAGATAGLALAKQVADSNGGGPGGVLARVAEEIADDRETLKRVMSQLGVRASPAKNASARMMEQVRRLKPNGRTHGDPHLHRMHELEVLSLGIAGKQALWEALLAAPDAAEGTTVDLVALADRARSQRSRVDAERLAMARVALSKASATAR